MPLETGFQFTNMNWAQVTNKGFEISLTTRNINTEDFSWTTTINFAKNKSNVDRIQVQDNEFLPSREGKPVNSVFGFKTAGLDDNGNILFWKNGEKVTGVEFFDLIDPWANELPGYLVESKLSVAERRKLFSYLGDADPKFTGGIINTFKIQNFDLTISAAFNLKQTVMRRPSYRSADIDPGMNYSREILNVWSPNNTNGTLPGITGADPYAGNDNWMLTKWYGSGDNGYGYNYLDIWAKDVSYMRISSIRLGYSFPKSLLSKIKLDNARITVEAKNLFVFGTSYKGYFDPESYGNIYAQPISKSVSLGLNLTF